jgi:hypothetical protein
VNGYAYKVVPRRERTSKVGRRSDRSAQSRRLWPGRLRRPPWWESRKEVECSGVASFTTASLAVGSHAIAVL